MSRTWPSPPPLTEAEPFLPEPDPDELVAVLDEMQRVAAVPDEIETDPDSDAPADRPFDHLDALDSVSVLGEMLLDGDPTVVGYAYLLTVCVYPMVPELLALQIAFGSGPVQRDLVELARLADRAARRGLNLDDYVDELHEQGLVPDTPAARMLRGETRLTPDDERMRRGIRVLRHAASLGDDTEQANIFCAIGWLHWALGQRALAQSYLSAAIVRAPEHAVAWGFAVMVGAGRPRWLVRRVTPRSVATISGQR